MKRKLLAFLMLIPGIGLTLQAQTDPGTANLTHRWTFDDGTANDQVGTVNGSFMGAAYVDQNTKALVTEAAGDYLSLPAADLALNTYSELTIETWYKSANTEWNAQVFYFGNVVNGLGAQGVFMTSSRSRTAISCVSIDAPWSSEDNVDGVGCNNGSIHHAVVIINATQIKYYVDGIFQGTTTLRSGNSIASLGTGAAYLAKSGYSGDPTWAGSIYECSIYNKALNSEEVKYLYQKGDGATGTIKTSVSSIETSSSASFKVWSNNLNAPISITAPAGVTVTPSEIPANNFIKATNVSVSYIGNTDVDGNITLTSGNITNAISIKASTTYSCFTPLYPDSVSSNLIADPYCSSYLNDGWGNKSINNDPAYIFCGTGSAKIDGGSYDRNLNGKLKPNTKYRLKAKIYQVAGTVGVGVYGYDSNSGDIYKAATTSNAWEDIDFTFVTGEKLKADGHGIFFNNGTGYIDNWELYEVPAIQLSAKTLTYLSSGSQKVAVSGVNLPKNIEITAPPSFTVNPSTLSSDAKNDTVSITYDGLATSNGYVYFTSDTIKDSIQVSGVADPAIVPAVSYLTFDELNKIGTFTIKGGNLSDSIHIVAPDGYTVSPSEMGPVSGDSLITVTFDGAAESKGYIIFTSGTAIAKVRVIGTLNATKFTPIHATGNIFADPYFNDLSTYGGWGNKTITTDTNEVYCGSRSLKMTGTCGASLDYGLKGKVLPNATYRLRAVVKTTGKYKFMINRCGVDGQNSSGDYLIDVNTNGEWQTIDTTFKTGTLDPESNNIFFNSCENYDGTVAYLDNYELYLEPSLSVSTVSLAFTGAENKTFNINGIGLTEVIKLTAPAGFTVTPAELPATTTEATITVKFDGAAASLGYIYVTSGSLKDSVKVKGKLTPDIIVDPSELTFAKAETKTFTVTGVSLIQSINITAPAGYTVTPNKLDATVSNAEVSVAYDGTVSSGYIYLVSGSVKDSVKVNGLKTAVNTLENNLVQNVYVKNGLITVSLKLERAAGIELSLYDVQGKLLAIKKEAYGAGINQTEFNMNLASGLYFVKIINDGKASSYKVIK